MVLGSRTGGLHTAIRNECRDVAVQLLVHCEKPSDQSRPLTLTGVSL